MQYGQEKNTGKFLSASGIPRMFALLSGSDLVLLVRDFRIPRRLNGSMAEENVLRLDAAAHEARRGEVATNSVDAALEYVLNPLLNVLVDKDPWSFEGRPFEKLSKLALPSFSSRYSSARAPGRPTASSTKTGIFTPEDNCILLIAIEAFVIS